MSKEIKFVTVQRGADTFSWAAFMNRWDARPARDAVFSNKDSIFLSLLFDTTYFISVSCLCWHLLSLRTLVYPCRGLHDPGAPNMGSQLMGLQMK